MLVIIYTFLNSLGTSIYYNSRENIKTVLVQFRFWLTPHTVINDAPGKMLNKFRRIKAFPKIAHNVYIFLCTAYDKLMY